MPRTWAASSVEFRPEQGFEREARRGQGVDAEPVDEEPARCRPARGW